MSTSLPIRLADFEGDPDFFLMFSVASALKAILKNVALILTCDFILITHALPQLHETIFFMYGKIKNLKTGF